MEPNKELTQQGIPLNPSKDISSLSKEDFVRLLEEIAVSAWHGNGRKTSVNEINTHFESSGLTPLMKQFTKDAEKGVISLLAAFYFRQAGAQIDGAQTFEFTHKSFGEYLMAKRIVEQTKLICRKIKENKENYDEGFDIKTGLKKWIKLFGPKVLDNDIVKFIRNEINSTEKKILKDAHLIICELINYELKNGLPIEREDLGIQFYKEENLYAVNAEKGLFVIRSLITMKIDECSKIEWTSKTDFGNLLKRIVEQRKDGFVFMLQFFNHINIKSQILHIQDLYGVNLRKSDLVEILSYSINLSEANLSGAHLNSANLSEANLRKTDLRDACLRSANLRTDLSSAKLQNTDLTGAILPDGFHSNSSVSHKKYNKNN